jgi:hypothetical protein
MILLAIARPALPKQSYGVTEKRILPEAGSCERRKEMA